MGFCDPRTSGHFAPWADQGTRDSGRDQGESESPAAPSEVDGASVGDASIVLPSEEGSVGLGRKWLVSALGIAHPAVDDSLQALSEVLTNAITYGVGRDVHIRCRQIDGYLEIAVINEVPPGGVRPQKQLLDEMAEHGRGLVLVDAYSESWGVVEMTASRRVKVWFRVRSA